MSSRNRTHVSNKHTLNMVISFTTYCCCYFYYLLFLFHIIVHHRKFLTNDTSDMGYDRIPRKTLFILSMASRGPSKQIPRPLLSFVVQSADFLDMQSLMCLLYRRMRSTSGVISDKVKPKYIKKNPPQYHFYPPTILHALARK
jgi:hypothetical protein